MRLKRRSARTLALLLALALALTLCACGAGQERSDPAELSFAQRMERSDALMQDTKSLHMDMTMDMAMEIRVGENTQRSEMAMATTMDLLNEPLQMAMDMSVVAGGSRQSLRYYAERNGGGVDLYFSIDDGDHWQKQRVSRLEDVTPQNTEEQMAMFLACADSFTETGREEKDGVRLIVYKGELSGAYVEQAVREAGTLDALLQSLGGELPEDLFRDLDPIEVAVEIEEESSRVRSYEMDMSAVMQTLMGRAMETLAAGMGAEGLATSVTVERVQIRVEMSRFDELVEIQIPEGAKAG